MKEIRPIERAANPDLRNSWVALQRAARRAREIAAQTGTAVVVIRDGVLQHVYPVEPDATLAQAREPSAPYGNRP